MILIALGANLPGPGGQTALQTCRAASCALDGIAGLALCGLSRWYQTSPIPPSGQPPYINGVARLAGTCDPALLLQCLQALEQSVGRQRSVPNAPRTLDLDIIAMDGLLRDAPDPILPHPRCHERAFVLTPLLDVAPAWRHPRLGLTASILLARLPSQGVLALAQS